MKRLIFISGLVFALLLMFACNEEQAVENKTVNVENPNNPQYSGATNPYDWVGEWHNNSLEYIYDTCLAKYKFDIWPDDSIINIITDYADNYFANKNSNVDYINTNGDSLANYYIINFMKIDELLLKLDNQINTSNLTEKDKLFGEKVLKIAILGLDSLYKNPITFLDSVYNLENEILSQSWSTDEIFSLMSISLLKNSLEYHINHDINDDLFSKHEKITVSEQDREGFKKIVSTCIDYSSGAGYFLSVTGVSGGAGTIAALSTASTVGSLCSSAAKAIGGALGLWDISWDDINPFS